MSITRALSILADSNNLSVEDMQLAMREVMTGQATDAQIGAFLMALHIKGETIDEIVGGASVMRELSTKVIIDAPNLVDTCGTGGDGANLFNVSTASAFVVAAAGGHVAKHGNRSVSSSTGSADVLEAAGVNLNVAPDVVARAVETIGVGFMFAPAHHSAMKHAIGPRKQLAMRTLFNLLGPMTNPASVKRQVMGVFDRSLCLPIAKALGELGAEHVLVVHSAEGLDELSVAGDSYAAEFKLGKIEEHVINPRVYGMGCRSLDGLGVATAKASLALIHAAFASQDSEVAQKASDIIALNAGAAIYVAGLASDLKMGVEMAEDAIASGGAQLKLNELISFTNAHS